MGPTAITSELPTAELPLPVQQKTTTELEISKYIGYFKLPLQSTLKFRVKMGARIEKWALNGPGYT